MALPDVLLAGLLLLAPLLHLALAPYSKVEESFSLQAAHDVLVYGTPLATPGPRLARCYDHFVFPGAVPRSFLGPVVLAALAQPLVAVVGFAHAQMLVRALLALANGLALLGFRRALARAWGLAPARWWCLLMASQFHILFYASRTLPNMFAFGLSTTALGFLLPRPSRRLALVRRKQAIGLLVFSAVIFRSELALLLAALLLQLLLRRQMSLPALVPVLVLSLITALALSVPVDSYFWQRPVWPELEAFYYNAVLGSASNWGVSPWHYYFTSALPRLLLNPLALPLILLALAYPATRRPAASLVLPSLLYVALYSFLPHKESRFVFYVVPPLTAAAALGANVIASRRTKSLTYRLGFLLLVGSLIASAAAASGLLLLSSLNYPGGEALEQLRAVVQSDASAPPTVLVHADVLTCMTGLTLFGINRAGLPLALGLPPAPDLAPRPMLRFDRSEDSRELASPRFWAGLDYALLQDPAAALGSWDRLGVVYGFDGLELLTPADPDPAPRPRHRVLGLAARLARWKRTVRSLTGGWWLGPRMAPRIHIMKRLTQEPTRYATS